MANEQGSKKARRKGCASATDRCGQCAYAANVLHGSAYDKKQGKVTGDASHPTTPSSRHQQSLALESAEVAAIASRWLMHNRSQATWLPSIYACSLSSQTRELLQQQGRP